MICPNCATELSIEGGEPGDQAQCPECNSALTLLSNGEAQLVPKPPVVRERAIVPTPQAYDWDQSYWRITVGPGLILVFLVGFAIFLLSIGFTTLTTATDGVGTIAAAGVILILARITQASIQYQVSNRQLREIGRTIASAPPR